MEEEEERKKNLVRYELSKYFQICIIKLIKLAWVYLNKSHINVLSTSPCLQLRQRIPRDLKAIATLKLASETIHSITFC